MLLEKFAIKNFFGSLLIALCLIAIVTPEPATAGDDSSTVQKIKKEATEAIEIFNHVISSVLFITIKKATCEDVKSCQVEWINGAEENILLGFLVNLPFLIFWLITAGIFFTIKLGFVNLRLFTHTFSVVRGKYSKDSDPGEVTHFQALSSAVSATVGLGNIAGVAVAVSLGGPGAVIWMMIAGFLGMSTKFAEVTAGLKYREIDSDGRINGGAFEYLSKGLAEVNYPKLGKVLALIFAIFCIGGSIGGGNMFQSNQATAILVDTFNSLEKLEWVISLIFAILVAVILIGGIKRIAQVASKIVPAMAFLYVGSCLVIIFYNIDMLGNAISTMFSAAFTGEAAAGGVIGAIINGFQRAAFSSEAGVGSAPTAHSTAKTTEPVREGVVALLEPFIDTIVICFMTGIVIVITNSYVDSDVSGVVLTSQAFATVSDWFPIVLSVAITLFAFSTIITWGYYGTKACAYLFGNKSEMTFKAIFCVFTFIGGIINLEVVIEFSDLLLLSMAIPNLLGLYFLSGIISGETKEYIRKLKNNEFEITK